MGIYLGSQAISIEAGGLPSALVTINNEPVVSELILTSTGVLNRTFIVGSMPYYNRGSISVVYNNEIHLFGGNIMDDENNYSYGKNHYKYIGSHWVKVSTLPCNTNTNYSVVVYHNELHLLGGVSNKTSHYKWDGSSWTSVSTLPFDSYSFCAVKYLNELHLLGGVDNSTSHYKWDGSSWTSVSTLPYNLTNHCGVVYEDKIHIVGSGFTLVDASDMNPYSSNHYSWDGSSWTSVSTIPIKHTSNNTLVCNNEIHILDTSTHYKWDGSSWKEMNEPPGSAITSEVLDNEIYILGCNEKDINMYKILSTKYKEA